MKHPDPRDGHPSGPSGPTRRAGPLTVARIMIAALFMIGRKGTWEKDGPGARLTPSQIIVGAVIGGIVLVILLVLLARTVIRLAAG